MDYVRAHRAHPFLPAGRRQHVAQRAVGIRSAVGNGACSVRLVWKFGSAHAKSRQRLECVELAPAFGCGRTCQDYIRLLQDSVLLTPAKAPASRPHSKRFATFERARPQRAAGILPAVLERDVRALSPPRFGGRAAFDSAGGTPAARCPACCWHPAGRSNVAIAVELRTDAWAPPPRPALPARRRKHVGSVLPASCRQFGTGRSEL